MFVTLFPMNKQEIKLPAIQILSDFEMNEIACYLHNKDFINFAKTNHAIFSALAQQLIIRKQIYEREKFALDHICTFKLYEIEDDYQSFDSFRIKVVKFICVG